MSSREEFEAWLRGEGYTPHRSEWQVWQAATKSMEAKCAALAAELNAVEAIHDDAVFITDDHYEQCPPEVQKIIRSLAVMQIPAYKSYLAEVRAQGVEMFAECAYTLEHHDHAVAFAAQLRQEAAK